MKKILMSMLTAAALLLGISTPAHAVATWPSSDAFWTVDNTTGAMQSINPLTNVVSKTVKKANVIHGDLIGGTWDAAHIQFIFVDGWTYSPATENHQGLVTYNPTTRKWKRYAINLGGGDSEGFATRDVAVAADGRIVLLVERLADGMVQANYLVTVTKLNAKKKVATANFTDVSTVRLDESTTLNSIVFDPSHDGVIVAGTYDYRLLSINAGTGATTSSHAVFSAPEEMDNIDIDSTGHFWAYGQYGQELSYGLIANVSENEEIDTSTGFPAANKGNVFIIQRG